MGKRCLGAIQSVGGYAFESDDLKYKISTDSDGNTIATATDSFWNKLTSNLGTTVNTVLDTVNKIGSTYQTVTGSNIINQQSQQSSKIDNDTITEIMNTAINQVKRYGMYVGVGIAGLIAYTIISNKRRKA